MYRKKIALLEDWVWISTWDYFQFSEVSERVHKDGSV